MNEEVKQVIGHDMNGKPVTDPPEWLVRIWNQYGWPEPDLMAKQIAGDA